jgi:hypothetical protein
VILDGPAVVVDVVVACAGANEARFVVGAEDTAVDEDVDTMTSCNEVMVRIPRTENTIVVHGRAPLSNR